MILDHIVLNVDNIDKMLHFYINVVGLLPERVHEYYDHKVPFPSVRINEVTIIDLFPNKMTKSKTNKLDHLCISLAKRDWDKLYQRIKDHQIAIIEGPVKRWGAQGEGTSMYFADPENNMIEARYYKE